MTLPTLLNSRVVVDQIDDDFLRRLVKAINELADQMVEGYYDYVLEENLDGDLHIAYMEVLGMFGKSYPELYAEMQVTR